MLDTKTVTEIPTTEPHVLAFEVEGDVRREDVEAMAERVLKHFDHFDSSALLLRLKDFGAADAVRAMGGDVLKSMARSPSNLSRYAVVGAPAAAQAMIETFGSLLPTESKAFDPGDEAAAWAFVGARPASV